MSIPIDDRTIPIPLRNVTLDGGFWGERLEINRRVTLPGIYRQLERTGRLQAIQAAAHPGTTPVEPHYFWDSDVAKWIEAAAYSLANHPSPSLTRKVDAVIESLAAIQWTDGYLNTYFTLKDRGRRWTNLRDQHELYCAGHLMEAAVAYFEVTGKRHLLDVMCRFADYIDTVFGREPGQMHGIPGHPEIELALMRMYQATGNARYRNLAAHFLDERGRHPCWFDVEAKARGEAGGLQPGEIDWTYMQSHIPVRQQTTAEGHAVRACYLYAGMTDVAADTGDEELLTTCRRLFENITERRMYIHGGIGSAHSSERFTFDQDLPNEEAYAETCAAISLIFFAQRMLCLDTDRRYADVIERALYNNVLAGVSLNGRRFFYDNVLACHPERNRFSRRNTPERQPFFDCACCPPNLARLLTSLGNYVYTQNERSVAVHLYAQSRATIACGNQLMTIEQQTDYPWSPDIRMTIGGNDSERFTLALRIPAWCHSPVLRINGAAIDRFPRLRKGYACISRIWQPGDRIDLHLPMPVACVSAHPSVRHNCGRVALQRGPLLYCLESADNGVDLNALELAADPRFSIISKPDILNGSVIIRAAGHRLSASGWEGRLYRDAAPAKKRCQLTAIPYFAWGNRGRGEMLVWIR